MFDFEDESDEEDNAGPDYDPDQEGKKGRKEEEHEGLDSGPMTSDTEQGTVSLIHTEMGDDDGTTSIERSATDTTTFRSPHRTASGAENGKVTGRLLSSPIPRRMTGDDGNSTTSSPYRPNPLLLLEDSHSRSSEERKDKNSATKRPLVTSSGQATSALTCPLADVVGRSPSVNYRFDGNMFKYTRKVRKNQMVTAGRLVTVLDMRPQMRGTRTNNNDSKVCSAIYK